MPACSGVGALFGDEGKGKVIDVIGNEADLVVRWMGGNNAGHTVKFDGKEYVSHIAPVGLLQRKKSAIAAGVVIDPRQLVSELEEFNNWYVAGVFDDT